MASPRTKAAGRVTPPKTKSDFDLDAVIAEGAGDPFTFTFDGDVYAMPADFDLRVIPLMSTGDMLGTLRQLLGDEQMDRLESSPKTFGVRAFYATLDAYVRHLGLGSMGELFASTGS